MKPLEMIHNSIGKRVIVQLRAEREYRGVLEGYDHAIAFITNVVLIYMIVIGILVVYYFFDCVINI